MRLKNGFLKQNLLIFDIKVNPQHALKHPNNKPPPLPGKIKRLDDPSDADAIRTPYVGAFRSSLARVSPL